MEKGGSHNMTTAVYGLLILLFCLQLHTGLCEVGCKSPKGKDADSDEGPVGELTGTIKWPFATENFEKPIQSPIDVITHDIEENTDLPELNINEPLLPDVKADVYNSGHTVYVYIKEDDRDKLPYLEGGPLPKNFVFDQMHFHWGRKDGWGSEHFMDSEAFAVEIHMVHFNSDYKDFEEALTKDDGIAVLTIFAEVGPEDNELLKPLHDLLPKLEEPNVHYKLPWNDAMQWAISAMTTNTEYYTYPGSLTTPPHSQNVAFIILPKPITVSHKQLTAFRELHNDENGDPITDNKRKLQPRNQRPIFKGRIQLKTK